MRTPNLMWQKQLEKNLITFDLVNKVLKIANAKNMIDDSKILTLHPQGKKGVNILKRRYDVIKDFILKTIEEHKEITYEKLDELAVKKLSSTFDGKVSWYIVTVKLDLEARGIIERIPKTSPHKLKMA
jgi:SOS response regulatory protein OraA/RecX